MDKTPPLHRRLILFIVDSWRVVMDNRFNPLKYIPDPSLQMYFTLVLFTMWSVYFGFVASYYMGWLGYDTITSLIVHFAVIVPIGFTNAIFMDAERENAPWLFKWRTEQRTYKLWQKIRRPNYEKRIPWDIDREA